METISDENVIVITERKPREKKQQTENIEPKPKKERKPREKKQKKLKKENPIDTTPKQQCTNCKCHRILSEFIGAKGDPVKRCKRCRDKDNRQKQRPEVMDRRNERQREKKYYVKYRETKRTQDEQAYLQHNAEVMRNWRKKNIEHTREWKKQNFVSRFYAIKQQAQKKGIVWNDDLTDEIGYKMMTSVCFYCNYKPENTLNGIDRMDNSGCYEVSNTVSCCKTCNFIKGCMDPKTFVLRCQHISQHFGGVGNPEISTDVWPDTTCITYNAYKTRAIKKNLQFQLTRQEFTQITNETCYYCDKPTTNQHVNGIDRKDNSIGYIIANCVSCCQQCNQMKGVLSVNDFVDTCKRVSDNSIQGDFLSRLPEITVCNKRISKRTKYDVPKTSIVITKQQPREIIHKIHVDPSAEPYVPKVRTYVRGSNLPNGCSIKLEDIPEHCYYVSATESKGDAFCCGKTYPKHVKEWTTTKSKKVSIEEKFQQLLRYLQSTE